MTWRPDSTEVYPLQNVYSPGRLFNWVILYLNLKNDQELADYLGVAGSSISRMRHVGYIFNAKMILKIYDTVGIDVKEIKLIIGDRRKISRNPQYSASNPSSLKLRAFRFESSDQGLSLSFQEKFRPEPRVTSQPVGSFVRRRMFHRTGSFMIWNSRLRIT